jgi:hypothetical protein
LAPWLLHSMVRTHPPQPKDLWLSLGI